MKTFSKIHGESALDIDWSTFRNTPKSKYASKELVELFDELQDEYGGVHPKYFDIELRDCDDPGKSMLIFTITPKYSTKMSKYLKDNEDLDKMLRERCKENGWEISRFYSSSRWDVWISYHIIEKKENDDLKKLPITKEAFEKSNYFKNKYGKLEYVSESGKVFKTDKGRILMFKEGTESNPRFKCMEGYDYSDDIRAFRDDVISALKKCYSHEYGVEPDMMDDKSILVSDIYAGIDYKIDISVSDEVDW